MKKRIIAIIGIAVILLCSVMWASWKSPTIHLSKATSKIVSIPFTMLTKVGELFKEEPSYGFVPQTLTLSVSEQVTSDQGEELSSYGLLSEQIDDFQRLVSRATGEVEVMFDKTQKIPNFIEVEISFPAEVNKPDEQGYYYFEQFKNLYRMKDPRKELKPTRTTQDRLQNRNVHYNQYYQGIEVVGAEMIVHVKTGDTLWFVQGKYIPNIRISTTPAIQQTSVPQIVQDHFITERGADITFTIPSLELGILNPWVFDRSLENKNVLIWVALLKEDLTGHEWTYYVNAQNGQILDVLDSAKDIDSAIWDHQNTTVTGDDELWYIDDALQTIPGGILDLETIDLNTFVTDYWTYLFNTFGVGSINSTNPFIPIDPTFPDGMQLVGHAYFVKPVDVDANPNNDWCPNASWDWIDNEAVFCQGRVARDIVAHEFTHGLVEHSGGNLIYRNQPGALNESFADVFGEFVDCAAGNCTWLHSTLRDLSNPLNRRGQPLRQQPDHTGNTGNAATDHPLYFPPCDPSVPDTDPNHCDRDNDFGGVHTNNGVPNIVAYLIVNGTQPGDSHYNYPIRGIGLAKAEQLYYKTLVHPGLFTTAQFTDARNVMVSVCKRFVSRNLHGVTLNDCC